MSYFENLGENKKPQPLESMSFGDGILDALKHIKTSWALDRQSATNFSTTSLFARQFDAADDVYNT